MNQPFLFKCCGVLYKANHSYDNCKQSKVKLNNAEIKLKSLTINSELAI